MNKKNVVVLGCTGMLGIIVLDYLSKEKDFNIVGTLRSEKSKLLNYKNVEYRILDAENATENDIENAVKNADWVVNCIGVIKPYIHDDNPVETVRALKVNSLFPHLLAKAAEKIGCKIIQIATDCVYSGLKGNYTEKDSFDALDVYGKTKSLGEVFSKDVFHLRCSIIGPERKAHLSLMDWFLGQPRNGSVNGFNNHRWNGVTTLHFAKLCSGIIKADLIMEHIQHIIPAGTISKADLLKLFAKEFNRQDINIKVIEADKIIDRTLATINQENNLRIWKAAGYKNPLTVKEMVSEIAKYKLND